MITTRKKIKDIIFHTHQYRLGRELCEKAANLLLEEKVLELENAASFEEILSYVETTAKQITRVGKLWSYDTALHIGFNKKVFPLEVYLHSGTKKGAMQLVRSNRVDKSNIFKKKSVPVALLPEEFHKFKPYEVENLLCTGKRLGWFK